MYSFNEIARQEYAADRRWTFQVERLSKFELTLPSNDIATLCRLLREDAREADSHGKADPDAGGWDVYHRDYCNWLARHLTACAASASPEKCTVRIDKDARDLFCGMLRARVTDGTQPDSHVDGASAPAIKVDQAWQMYDSINGQYEEARGRTLERRRLQGWILLLATVGAIGWIGVLSG